MGGGGGGETEGTEIMCMYICVQVKELSPLCQLPQLHTLNIAHCRCGREIGSLSGCGQLTSLNLSGVPAGLDGLQLLSGGCGTCSGGV